MHIQKRLAAWRYSLAALLILGGIAMSQEQLQNEFNYIMSLKILDKMLAKGLITQEEFLKIDKLNRISFSPILAPLMS